MTGMWLHLHNLREKSAFFRDPVFYEDVTERSKSIRSKVKGTFEVYYTSRETVFMSHFRVRHQESWTHRVEITTLTMQYYECTALIFI